MSKATTGASTDRAARMAMWAKHKRIHGRHGWKAAKKAIKRERRELRRNLNAIIDNAALVSHGH